VVQLRCDILVEVALEEMGEPRVAHTGVRKKHIIYLVCEAK